MGSVSEGALAILGVDGEVGEDGVTGVNQSCKCVWVIVQRRISINEFWTCIKENFLKDTKTLLTAEQDEQFYDEIEKSDTYPRTICEICSPYLSLTILITLSSRRVGAHVWHKACKAYI